MALRMGILGKKLGMTQFFVDDGERIPVTLIQTGPNFVVGKRFVDKDGYVALQIGFGAKPKRLVKKPQIGFFKAAGVDPVRTIREIRVTQEEADKFEVGQELKAQDVFEAGAPLDVIGVNKGKGFQGVIKRHGMHGTKASHGVHEVFRHGGSIGCRLTPGRVVKGKSMPGQMGNVVQTIQNLQLVQIFEDENCIAVRGSVPGAPGAVLTIKKAATRDTYKRVGMGGTDAVSKNPLKASKKAAAGR